jgi:solute carrier family 25 iron transporter 28/37
VFYPLDTIRTLQQTSTNFSYVLPLPRYFQGLGASVALSTPAFAVYMVSYRQCKQLLTPYLGETALMNYIASGSVSQILSSFIWTPMEVIKGRMQIQQGRRNTIRTMGHIYKTDGIRGFFRGYWIGIAVFLPHSVVWWTSYERIKQFFQTQNPSLGPLEYGISSCAASASAAIVSNFLDVVKTRQQLAASEEITKIRPDDRMGIFKIARNLIREVGFCRALFKGLHIRLSHSLPSSALAMIIVESVNPDRTTTTDEMAALEDFDV